MAKNKHKKKTTVNSINSKKSIHHNNDDNSFGNGMIVFAIVVAIVAMGIVSVVTTTTTTTATTTTGNSSTEYSRKATEETGNGMSTTRIIKNVDCTEDNLSQFLHKKPVKGMHIVCFHDDIVQMDDENGNATRNIPFTTYPNMIRKYKSSTTTTTTTTTTSTGTQVIVLWDLIEIQLVQQLGLPFEGSAPDKQPWSIFTTRGELIYSSASSSSSSSSGGSNDDRVKERAFREVMESGMVLIMTGGAWVWPGVKEGFQREIELSSVMPGPIGSYNPHEPIRTVILETISLKPLLFSVENFIDDEECDRIQELASPTIEYSGVSLHDNDQGKDASQWRTSQSTFLHPQQDHMLRNVELRTASLTRCPSSHQEHTQVLRYGNGEKYVAHNDYFDPKLYQKDPSTLALIDNGRKNRLATVLWYLSDVEKGGHTNFPRYGGRRVFDFADCSNGIKVKPKKGKVIIFYSLDAAGDLDPLSMHAACPVEEGIKWAANKWVWNAPMNFY